MYKIVVDRTHALIRLDMHGMLSRADADRLYSMLAEGGTDTIVHRPERSCVSTAERNGPNETPRERASASATPASASPRSRRARLRRAW